MGEAVVSPEFKCQTASVGDLDNDNEPNPALVERVMRKLNEWNGGGAMTCDMLEA
jgi:hypothetical protein